MRSDILGSARLSSAFQWPEEEGGCFEASKSITNLPISKAQTKERGITQIRFNCKRGLESRIFLGQVSSLALAQIQKE